MLVVSNGNGNRTSQVYYPDDGSPQWCRLLNESNWLPWYQLSTKKDISNAINKFDLSKVKFRKQYLNGDGQAADKTWSATKNDDGTYTIDLYHDDWTASKLADVIAQLPNKANTSDVYTKSQTDDKLGQKITFIKCDSTQAAHDASTKPAADGSIVFGIHDMNDDFINGKRLLTSSDTFSGGVNLFRNTDKLDKFWMSFTDNNGSVDSPTNYASDVNHELIATKSVFHAWGLKASDAGVKTTQQIYFEKGVYTISFLARNNGTDSPSFNLSLYSDYTDSHGGLPVGSTSANLTNIWQRYSITFKIDQAGTYGGWRLINWSDAQVPGGSLFFANLKLERGPVATDWCPAPEDYAMKSDVNDLRNQVQQLKDNQFEVQTFTDATAAANWEAQRPGKRMAIVNS